MTEKQYADEWTVKVKKSKAGNGPIQADSNQPTTAKDELGKGLYMDVGLWSGCGGTHEKKRNFGVVHGNWAVLCEFVPDNSCDLVSELSDPETADLKLLLQEIQGNDAHLKLVKSPLRYTGLKERNQDTDIIEVFLPDLHFPVTNQQHYEGLLYKTDYHLSDGPTKGRWEYAADAVDVIRANPVPYHYSDIDGTYKLDDGTPVLWTPAETWFERFFAADIHEGASDDLLIFLERLKQFDEYDDHTEIRLIQTGDMIDLWMGFECFFEGTPDNDAKVLMSPSRNGKPSGEQFVDYWTNRALNQGGNNQRALEQLGSWPTERAYFLYGNHDNYLLEHAGRLPKRKPSYRHDGLQSEHGHSPDFFNRDGKRNFWIVEGHDITNVVCFEHPETRSLTSRATYPHGYALEHAADYFLNDGVGIYVQGHSHKASLGIINVVMK